MEGDAFVLVVEGLDKIDALELVDELGEEDFNPATLSDDDQRLGEPGTIAIIGAVGAVALPPLMLWLAKRKKWFCFSEVHEVTLPDGTKVKRAAKMSIGATEPPSASELKALAGMTGTSASDLADLLGPAEDQ